MLALHIALYCLLGTGFLFAVIELGLGGYVVSQWSGVTSVCDGYGFYCEDVKVSTPGILSFLIFTAVWTMLVSVAGVVLPFFFARKGNVTHKLNMILGIATIITFFITCVFWLASFADIVTIYSASNTYSDYLNAVVAFAVLNWLIFMALVILTILTAVGVLLSSWPGYQSMRQDRAPQGTGPPVNDVPMSTAPAAAPVPVHAHPHAHAHHDNIPAPVAVPSELSARDAEALHDQAPSQSHSISSPSAVTSVELDGGNGHKY